MGNATGKGMVASYDAVGRYRQDEINGFTDELLDGFLDSADPAGARNILDAMAGDGNLTLRLQRYCAARGLPFPRTSVLEYSRVQAEFARHALDPIGVRVYWGDALSMSDLETGAALPRQSYDRVLIKSSNHEIPKVDQPRLYQGVFDVLRPGGSFHNLGFLFEDVVGRDEFGHIARAKDRLAGMEAAVRNRYFLTRAELYGFLEGAGFVDVRPVRPIEYRIRSRVVAGQYFAPEVRERDEVEFQIAQVRALALRRDGHIRFEGDESVMMCPGEITIARRPTMAETNARIYQECAQDFLRHVRAHSELLREAARHIPDAARVLDLGCGIGLLAEYLSEGVDYLGLDRSAELTSIAARRYSQRPGIAFAASDPAGIDIDARHDVVTLLQTLHLPGVDAVDQLRRALRALRPGGRLILSAPVAPDSLASVGERISTQLEQDRRLQGREGLLEVLRDGHRRLALDHGSTWSAEGMVALLRHLGFGDVLTLKKDLYFGAAYLIVAGR